MHIICSLLPISSCQKSCVVQLHRVSACAYKSLLLGLSFASWVWICHNCLKGLVSKLIGSQVSMCVWDVCRTEFIWILPFKLKVFLVLSPLWGFEIRQLYFAFCSQLLLLCSLLIKNPEAYGLQGMICKI